MKAWFTTKVWPWLRWVLSGLGLLLAAVLTFGLMQRKIGQLQDKNKVTKALSDVKVLQVKRDVHIEKEAELEVVDDALTIKGIEIEDRIFASKKRAVEASARVEELSDAEVVDRFNDLFGD